MHLRELEVSETPDVIKLIKEIGQGENGFAMALEKITDMKAYLTLRKEESLGINLKPNRVPQTVYWIYEKNKLAGVIKIRKELTLYLLEHGGHIGYYIRKKYRQKGYATQALKLALQILQDNGTKRALITCDVDNIGSEKVILNNGGILEDIRDNTKRFWIKTDIN